MRRFAAPVLLCVAALLAGCGSGSSSSSSQGPDAAFKRAFLVQIGGLHVVGGRLTTALAGAPAESDAQVRKVFAGLAHDTAPVLAGLATLNPPARYRPDLVILRHSLARARHDLLAVARAAGAHHPAALKLAFKQLKADSAAVKAADNRITLGVAAGG